MKRARPAPAMISIVDPLSGGLSEAAASVSRIAGSSGSTVGAPAGGGAADWGGWVAAAAAPAAASAAAMAAGSGGGGTAAVVSVLGGAGAVSFPLSGLAAAERSL